ncbi:hypothetical protein [Aureimonas phyllosphaerae]|uniref:Uncharacterized protein n=1 Tax=Aureimonas phyllosphaerae TaxID=1166078 RepID=A0A7W6BX08_9HYPH|nr:hypothetical protein [Aureimonas phyllosphaerae]MBB3937940.1 hypothetical protein [Aureimonas phyllosphaerae]MBB3961887.1 hypothetical protein [Aureimonas phyllosphaerae]SFF54457.1 hypothetical protein SAMN05216566_12515 [Aureimonas phyllosphaerae]
MSAMGGVRRGVRTLSERQGGVPVGGIDYFEFDPGGDWLPADGRLIDRTDALAAVFLPSAAIGNVVGTLPLRVRDGCYGGGKFVFGCEGGKLIVTTDLVSFTTATLPNETGYVNSVVYAKGTFAAFTSTLKVYRSTDGLTWTLASTPDPTYLNVQTMISFVAGLFMLVRTQVNTGNSDTVFLSSPDLVTWTQRGFVPGVLISVGDVRSDGDLLVMTSASNSRLISTRDGVNFAMLTVNFNGAPTAVSVADGIVYVGTRASSGTSTPLISDDGLASTSQILGTGGVSCSVHRVGDEVIETRQDGGSNYVMNGVRRAISGADLNSGSDKRVLVGNGLAATFELLSTSYRRSTKLRLPRAYRRPSTPNLKPYVKVV